MSITGYRVVDCEVVYLPAYTYSDPDTWYYDTGAGHWVGEEQHVPLEILSGSFEYVCGLGTKILSAERLDNISESGGKYSIDPGNPHNKFQPDWTMHIYPDRPPIYVDPVENNLVVTDRFRLIEAHATSEIEV